MAMSLLLGSRLTSGALVTAGELEQMADQVRMCCVSRLAESSHASRAAAFRRFVPKLGCAVNPEFGCDLRGIRLGDAGDAHGETLEAAHADLTARVTQVLRAGAVPFVVGGGNDQSYANARALLDTKGDSQVSVVNIDAHLVRHYLWRCAAVHTYVGCATGRPAAIGRWCAPLRLAVLVVVERRRF